MGKTIKCKKCGKEVATQGFKIHDKYCRVGLTDENLPDEENKKEKVQGLKKWITDKPEFRHLL